MTLSGTHLTPSGSDLTVSGTHLTPAGCNLAVSQNDQTVTGNNLTSSGTGLAAVQNQSALYSKVPEMVASLLTNNGKGAVSIFLRQCGEKNVINNGYVLCW